MALVTMKQLLDQARNEHRGTGAFSVGNMEMVKGAVQAAEELKTPIILQIAEVRLKHSPLALMGPMMVQAAKEASVDIAAHLDHGLTLETVQKALDLGFTSVMFDSSLYPFEENIARTKEVVSLAKRYGATVEAELGLVGGSEDGKEGHGIRCTDPADAEIFCRETGVDALAVESATPTGIILPRRNWPLTYWRRFRSGWKFLWCSMAAAGFLMRISGGPLSLAL